MEEDVDIKDLKKGMEVVAVRRLDVSGKIIWERTVGTVTGVTGAWAYVLFYPYTSPKDDVQCHPKDLAPARSLP